MSRGQIGQMLRWLTVSVVAVTVFGGTGCGGGESTAQEPTPISKNTYLKRADAICQAAEKTQEKLLNEFGQAHQGVSTTDPKALEDLVVFAAIPPLKQQAAELADLPAPTKEAAKAAAYLKALQKGIASTSREPHLLSSGEEPGPFFLAENLALQFGFKTCRGA